VQVEAVSADFHHRHALSEHRAAELRLLAQLEAEAGIRLERTSDALRGLPWLVAKAESDRRTSASSNPSDGARTAIGDEAGLENGAVGPDVRATTQSAALIGAPDRSTFQMANGRADDTAAAQTTTAS
jgi:hypothetical protein